MTLLNKIYDKIDYDEIEIYSYNRGLMLSNYLNDLDVEKKRLIEEMKVEEDFSKELELNKRVKYIEKYMPLDDELTNKEAKLHPTANLVAKFKREDIIAREIGEIFISEINSPIASRCIAKFRDGLVFKKEGEIQEVFSICFECATIKSKSEGEVYGDAEFYKSYRKILLKIGHNVDEV